MSDVDLNRLLLFHKAGFPNLFRTWHNPGHMPVAAARFLRENDEVLAVEWENAVRAYPANFIAAHHIVEDQINDHDVLVTY